LDDAPALDLDELAGDDAVAGQGLRDRLLAAQDVP